MGGFDDLAIWITGGGSGLGKHLAVQFARQGGRVAVSGRRTDRLDQVVAEITAAGGHAIAVPCDVTDEDAVRRAVDEVVARFGRLDVAVANAGIGIVGRVEDLSMAMWRRQMEVNVVGAAITAARAAPHLRRTRGRLVLVGSVSAVLHFKRSGPYQASKAALAALGNTLALELADDGISVTTLHPGFIRTEIHLVDNHGRLDPTRRDRRPAWLIAEPEPAARAMVRAIRRRRRVFIYPNHGRIGWWLGRYAPGFVAWVARFVRNRAEG